MGSPSSQSYTICLRSTDARLVAEGVYEWTLASENCRQLAGKMYLASIELPLSQWSVEEAWNRVYFVERIRLTAERRTVVVEERARPSGAVTTAVCTLPLYLNALASVQVPVPGSVTLVTREPHALSDAMFEWARTQEDAVKAICTPVGTLDISAAWREGRVRVEDARTLRIEGVPQATAVMNGKNSGYLLFESPATPSALASMLTTCVHDSPFGARASVAFDAATCYMAVCVAAYPEGASGVTLRVSGDALAAHVGLRGAVQTFERERLSARTAGYGGDRGFLQHYVVSHASAGGDATPLVVSASAASLFSYVELRPGCYYPCQRAYSATPPLKLAHEWDLQFSRLTFAPRDGNDVGLVYTDPRGVDRILVVVPGSYTVGSFTAYLTQGMNDHARGAYVFSVTFEDGRFVFACTTGAVGDRVGVLFAIHFNHARSIDAARLGFDDQAYLEGADRYESSYTVHVPDARNEYSIGEVAGQRKLSIRPTAPAACICVVEEAATPSQRFLGLHCVRPDGAPVAHGLREGTVVLLGASGGVVQGEGDAHESVALDVQVLGVVVRNVSATRVHVEVPGDASTWAVVGRALKVAARVEPSSFCFCPDLPRTIGGARLGFAPRTIQYGVDGSVRTRSLRLPPYVSSGSYDFDHVSSVFLQVGKDVRSTTTLTYEMEGRAAAVFAKIVLNPTFRHERALEYFTGLVGYDRCDRLTLHVLNPDWSAYHFHDAEWSVSITFV